MCGLCIVFLRHFLDYLNMIAYLLDAGIKLIFMLVQTKSYKTYPGNEVRYGQLDSSEPGGTLHGLNFHIRFPTGSCIDILTFFHVDSYT